MATAPCLVGEAAVRGAAAIENLKAGDRILISEGCTHHRQCGDIGTEKLPNWIRRLPVRMCSSRLPRVMSFLRT